MSKAAFCSLGCKVNQYETDAMRQKFKEHGYEIVNFEEPADVYIVNTCTVTSIADRKSRQMLHRAKKNNKNAVVAAVGCYVQTDTDFLKNDDLVDILIGNNRKKDILEIVEKAVKANRKTVDILDIGAEREYEKLSLDEISDHTRAYIKIQDGCNQFCSYCLIPVARGRVRSRQYEDIVAEINRLAAIGYKEIVLTGIHISSYGLDFDCENYNNNTKNDHLIQLIEGIAKDTSVDRIRLGSLEPRIITENFAKRIAAIKKICPHFHLSLQSGCNDTLKRMNRHYTVDEFLESCDNLRSYMDNPAITTDIIVGFPGETEEEFEKSKAFLEEVNFFQMHIFKYSKRAGTKAAEMKDQIDPGIKHERSKELIALSKEMEESYLSSKEGMPCEILTEEAVMLKGKEYYVGHTREYIKALVSRDGALINEIIAGKLVKKSGAYFVEK